jgi:NAD(P)-dependent dehydrogenase (short-subunit alcohol dehydrogenase family)
MNILITGCSRGIGRGFLETYLQRSEVKKVFAVTTHAAGLKALQDSAKGKLQILPFSVSEESTVGQLAEALAAESIDLLINCAGTYPKEPDDFEKIKIGSLEEGMRVNTYSVFFVLQGCLPALQRAKHAKVASLTSLMGSISDNTSGGAYAYRISKAALNMLNKSFANDYPELTSVVFHPGWVKTDMGGANAPTSIEESVKGMVKKIDALKNSDTGGFFDHEGDAVEW